MRKKKIIRKLNQRIIVIITVILVAIMVLNVLLMYDIATEQTEEIGRMRIQNFAARFQKSLTQAENTLDRVSNDLEQMLLAGASWAQIQQFLSEQKDIEYSTNELCMNVFCVVDGVIMISDMATPEDYVFQDRTWYRGLLTKKKGEIYISPTYEDAFTHNMCFTVAKIMNDGTTVIGVDYSVSEIQSYVEEMSSDGYGDAMIVDANEMIVGYTNSNMIGKKLSSELPQYRDAFLRAVAADTKNFSLHGGIDEMDSTIFCSRTDNGWYMMCSVSNWSLYHESYMQMLRNFILMVMFLLVIVVLYFLGQKGKLRLENAMREKETQKASETSHQIMQNYNSKKTKEKFQIRLTVDEQRKYQIGITSIFVVTMVTVITCSASMTINESRIKMESELQEYNYKVGDWILEQKSILDMFENVVAAKPELLDNYDEMVKFLDDITRHYPKISATYIANPAFAHTHGHPMVMNNGWVPEESYVEEERIWYTGALTAEDFNITEPYYDARTGEYCITFSKVVESDNGDFYGIFAIDFYLDALMEILGEGYSDDGYAFLVDKNGSIIDHPNSEYRLSDEESVNIHSLVYDKLYSKSGMVLLKDYDGKYKVCTSIDEVISGFRIVVVKNWWSIYGNVLEYTALFLILIGSCILAVNVLISKMIKWQRNAYDQFKKAANLAIQAEQAKSQFLSNMSHEIRTPINAVLGMNEMILRECNDKQLLSYAANIQSSGKTLLFLINDILDMSKIESGKMEIIPTEYELGDLFLDLWNAIYVRASEKNLKITFLPDETLPKTLFGDDVRIKQIISNILTNAVKYTPKGEVELRANYEKLSDEMMLLIVSVKDTGMGIKEEDMGKLFEDFRRLDEDKNRNIEGTGLGMNIIMALLGLMDGEIKVESEYQKGSTFTVTIPQKIINSEPIGDFESVKSRQRQGKAGSQETFEAPEANILVVDDNAMNLVVFKALLKRTNMNIVTAESGKYCLELVKEQPFHIIFMDHMMPGMDGVETLHEIKKLSDFPNEDTPIIVLTANALSGARESYLNVGFTDFLTKPVDGDKLEKMIVAYLPEDIVHQKDSSAAETQKNSASDYEPFLDYGISIESGISYSKGSIDIYLDLIEMFLNDSKMQDMLQQFISENDMPNYGIQVHALKGNSRTLGADKLADIAFEHEKQSKAGNIDYVKEHWDELINAWETARRGLKEFCTQNGRDRSDSYDLDEREILDISSESLREVASLIDDFETEKATAQLKQWLESPLKPEMRERIKNALAAIEMEYDDDKAMEILNED